MHSSHKQTKTWEQVFKKASNPRQKFSSVQHRLENARNRPVRPDLEDLVHNQTFENSCEELANGISKLALVDDELKNLTSNVDDNQNELPCTTMLLGAFKPEQSPKSKANADELFFRLSRGIRILPEGLPGIRGMVTPLCPKNDELKEQIDKYCVIPEPWTAAQLRNLPECICFRNVLYSCCKNCGHIMKGRVYKKCKRHPGIAFLLDFFFCYECLAETDQLYEV